MKHLHPMFGWILSDTLGIEEKQETKQDDKKKETDMKHDFTVVEGIDMMLCKEGTTFWALAQMKKGFKVWQPKTKNIFNYDESCYYPIRQKDKSGTMINRHTENNFIKEFSDTFEIYREAKFKVGDWVKNKNTGKYCQIVGVNSGSKYAMQVRKAGSNTAIMAAVEDYEPASLNPDFSKAKVGDEVFTMDDRYKKITVIYSDHFHIYAGNSWFDVRGFPSSLHKHEHPTLFHSHHQAKAYFDELFMKLDEEQR